MSLQPVVKIKHYQGLLLGFIIGVGLAALTAHYFLIFWLIMTAGLLAVISKKKYFLLMSLVLALGLVRFQLSLPVSEPGQIYYYNNRQIEFVAKIMADPDLKNNYQKITVGVLMLNDNKISGKVLIFTDRYPAYVYGDILKINCKLQAPVSKSDSFNYAVFLSKDNIYSVCNYPVIEKVGTSKKNLLSYIYDLKEYSQQLINKNISEPAAGLLEAMMLGDRSDFSAAVYQNFKITGTAHLVAISGLHIAIIISILTNTLLAFNFSRRQSFFIISIILFLYLLMIGFPASALRAVIMGWLGLASYQAGRSNQSSYSLTLTAAIMIFINPKILVYDVGFQLSFLAVLGIMFFSKFWNKVLNQVPSLLGLKDSLVMSLSAQVTTAPLLLFSFNQFSLISPLANLFVVPLLPYVLLTGFLATATNILIPTVPSYCYWPVSFLVIAIINTVNFFAAWPWAAIQF